MTPYEANARYTAAEKAAADEYRQYWHDKFEKAGIKFVVDRYQWVAEFNDYKLSLWTWPRRFQGAKLTIHAPNAAYTQKVKVMSDSGFAKLMLKLRRKQFV